MKVSFKQCLGVYHLSELNARIGQSANAVDEQLFQFSRTDALYFEDRLIWPVAVNSDK